MWIRPGVLPILLVVLWLVAVAPLGMFTGKLAEVQQNDNAAFLPADAESTRVFDLLAELQPADESVAVIVWETGDEDAATVLDEFRGQLDEIAGLDAVVADTIEGPFPSDDGRAVQARVTIDFGADSDRLRAAVGDIRAIVAESPDGWEAYLTGAAGFANDLSAAFGAIDGLLLAVALVVVFLILVAVYRSPLLPVIVLVTAVLALALASAAVYALAANGVIDLNGQSQGIMFILVIGAATDYALLVVSRYREELRRHRTRGAAMRAAYRGVIEPIAASGATVILGLLCLLASGLSSLTALGPIGALGIGAALAAALTFLPAALVLLGRAAYWPFGPEFSSESEVGARRLWDRIAGLVERRPRAVWVTTLIGLLALAACAPQFRADGVAQSEFFLTEVEAVAGQEALAEHFDAGSGDPILVIVDADETTPAVEALESTEGVGDVAEPVPLDAERVLIVAVLSVAADSLDAAEVVREVRGAFDRAAPSALVGGGPATLVDTLDQASDDRVTIIVLIVVVTLLVLIVLLRSVLAPVLLMAANVLSFLATLGLAALVFNHLLGFPGADPTVVLLAFVFLIALGIDYTIFLMTRVREESLSTPTEQAILTGLRTTGGVITSAGVVLAATFAALAVIPLLFLVQVAFLVSVGVLIDTLIVRSLLVPALGLRIGRRLWWPSRLSRES